MPLQNVRVLLDGESSLRWESGADRKRPTESLLIRHPLTYVLQHATVEGYDIIRRTNMFCYAPSVAITHSSYVQTVIQLTSRKVLLYIGSS